MSKPWQQTLIRDDQNLRKAIEVLDKNSRQIVLVTDEEGCLLGTITDGDIRRALLNQASMSTCVTEIMNTEPVVAASNLSNTQLKDLMQCHGLMHIPIVHEDKVAGLATLKELVTKHTYDNPVFLMAGGFGKRLKPLTDSCPKPLLTVGDKPILETILENFIEAGFHRFYISTHYLNEMIENYFKDGSDRNISIEYINEREPQGTAGALALLPDTCPNLPLILMNGDILTKINVEKLLQFHQQQQAHITASVREYDLQVPYGVIHSDKGFITAIQEKPIHSFFINAGIYVINPQIYRELQPGKAKDMPDLIQDCLEKKQKVAMFPIHEYWLDIGKLPDFHQAQVDYQRDFQ